MLRYSTDPSERIRHELNLSPRQFSVRIDYDPQAYPLALERGYLTQRMAKEISRRWKVPLGEFKVDGEKA